MTVATNFGAVLSAHYGEFTVTRSASINRLALAPRLSHPWNHPSFVRVHAPPDGRVSTWEDPSLDYGEGDPYAELRTAPSDPAENARRQLGQVALSVGRTRDFYTSVDGTGLAVLATLLVPALALTRRREELEWRHCWVAFPPLLAAVAYMPFLPFERYLWPVWIPILAALGLLHDTLIANAGNASTRLGRGGRLLLSVVALAPAAHAGLSACANLAEQPPGAQLTVARELAQVVRESGQSGPVVSWSPYTSKGYDMEGMYLAWVLGEPWLGHVSFQVLKPTAGEPVPTYTDQLTSEQRQLEEAISLGARALLVKTRNPDRKGPSATQDDDTPPTSLPPGAEDSPPPWVTSDPRWHLAYTLDEPGGVIRPGRMYLFLWNAP